MGNMLDEGVAALLDDLKGSASYRVKYTQGAGACQWDATLGRSEYLAEDDNQVVVTRHTDMDFHGAAADLVIGGDPVTPAPGDRIELFRSRATETYEVMPVDKQCFKLDATQQKLTIFTKRVKRA